jgi:hypothetical protein
MEGLQKRKWLHYIQGEYLKYGSLQKTIKL